MSFDPAISTASDASIYASIYVSMVAGAFPLHEGDIDKTVFMVAQDVLGTAQLHLLVSADPAQATVYYFAAPSTAFASALDFATPLAAAFPSHPQHRGDGIYFLKAEKLAIAVEKVRDQMRMVANTPEAMSDWLAERPELPVHDVADLQPWAMESIPGAYRRITDGISQRVVRYSAYATVVSLVVYLAASIGISVVNASADKSNQAHMSAINAAVARIDFISPLSQQVARMKRVSALVVRAGGWIEEYEFKNGTEKFVLMMPAWITKDYIDALGPKVEADLSNDENLIRVSLASPLPGTTPVPWITTQKPVKAPN